MFYYTAIIERVELDLLYPNQTLFDTLDIVEQSFHLFKTTADLSSIVNVRLANEDFFNGRSAKEYEYLCLHPDLIRHAVTPLEKAVVLEFIGVDDDPEEGDYIASDLCVLIKEGIEVEEISF